MGVYVLYVFSVTLSTFYKKKSFLTLRKFSPNLPRLTPFLGLIKMVDFGWFCVFGEFFFFCLYYVYETLTSYKKSEETNDGKYEIVSDPHFRLKKYKMADFAENRFLLNMRFSLKVYIYWTLTNCKKLKKNNDGN